MWCVNYLRTQDIFTGTGFLTYFGLSNRVTMAEGIACKLHPTQKQVKWVNMNWNPDFQTKKQQLDEGYKLLFAQEEFTIT